MNWLRLMHSRRARNPRILVVPDQWSGSVQEFYHFLLGYFAPLVLWLEKNPRKPFSVRDCGPMNPWFELLPGTPDLEVLTPGDMLHLFAACSRPSTVLKGMDDPTRFRSGDLKVFRSLVLSANGVEVASSGQRVTVIDRLSSGSFNKTTAAEVPASGRDVRSTPNLSPLATALLEPMKDVQWGIVDAAGIPPQGQLELFSSTTLLVGQHGAGLANMVWMPPGGTVVEIEPPRPEYEPPFFQNLAQACRHTYIRIDQEHDHAEISEREFHAALNHVLDGGVGP